MSFLRRKQRKNRASSSVVDETSELTETQTRVIQVEASEPTSSGSSKKSTKHKSRADEVLQHGVDSEQPGTDSVARGVRNSSTIDQTDVVTQSVDVPSGVRRARAAWTDDVETSGSPLPTHTALPSHHNSSHENHTSHESPQHHKSHDTNHMSPAKSHSSVGDYDNMNINEMLDELQYYIESTERQVTELTSIRNELHTNAQQTLGDLDDRFNDIQLMLRRCRDEAKREVEMKMVNDLEELNSSIQSTSDVVRALQKIHDKFSPDDNNEKTERLRGLMFKVHRRCSKLAQVSHNPPDGPSTLQPAGSPDNLCSTLNTLLGLTPADTSPDTQPDIDTRPQHDQLQPSQLVVAPRLVQTVSCRWKKDKTSCGIVDVALTDGGRLFVVDQHNKTIKVYNIQQTSGKCKLLQVLGRDVLVKPSRVSFVAVDNEIVVTDDGTHKLQVFSAVDGSDLGLLATPHTVGSGTSGGGGTGSGTSGGTSAVTNSVIEHPVSCCVTPQRDVVCVDFNDKSLVCWNLNRRQQVSRVDTQLDCPAYIAVTDNTVAVTDWKLSCVKLLSRVDGTETSRFPRQSTAAASNNSLTSQHTTTTTTTTTTTCLPLLEPHGVCSDSHGLLFVADRRQRAVHVFSEVTCQQLMCYTEQQHKIGVPYAVACNSHGLLAIADYVGTVRIFSYWQETNENS